MKKITIVLAFIFSFFNYSYAYEFSIANFENIQEYRNELGKKIQNNWRLTSADKNLEAIIKAKVDKDGKYDNEIKVIKSSGSAAYDEKIKQAFLASIDKDDELLRFHPEFTFKNGTVFVTENGLTHNEQMTYREILFSLGNLGDVIVLKDRDLFDNNAYIIFKTNKKGDILDSKIVNAKEDKVVLKLENAKKSVKRLPEAPNFSKDEFWAIIVYTKFASTPFIRFALSEKDIQKTLAIEEWKTHCFRTIENMWKADDSEIQCTLPVTMIMSKDGYIKEFKFNRRKLNIASFIMRNIKLPALTVDDAFNSYIDAISFESAATVGRYITVEGVAMYQSQVPWGEYMRELEHKIKANWRPSQDNRSKRVVVCFTVLKNGSLKDGVKIIVSSGSKLSDEIAIEAVTKALPFRPLPKEFQGNSVPIEFTFDYNVNNMRL